VEVDAVHDGETALARLSEQAATGSPYTLVVLDMCMPGMDGLEALPEIRRIAPDAAIVVFSGFAADRMSATALSLGADRYLEKGEPLEVVRATVRDAAGARRRPGAA